MLRRSGRALLLLIFLTACSTTATRSSNRPGQLEPPQSLGPSHTTVIDSNKTTDERIVDFREIPKEYQDLVMQWVGYFQGRGREHMERYLSRSARYIPMMKTVLRQNELPEDLVYIALIESGFSPKALSRAGAVGYWQFIRATGKSYGLANNRLMDERRDFELSTEAAAQYFKGLYNLFGSWPLAIAAYNVGENRIKRVVMKKQTRDLWELITLKQLPRETANYVPKFIAAEMIAREPARFGFSHVQYETPLAFDRVTSTKPVNLKRFASGLSLEYEDVQRLNPKYKTHLVPLENGQVSLRVPKGTKEAALVALETSFAADSEIRIAGREVLVPSNRYYKVKKGDTAQKIAARFDVSTEELIRSAKLPRSGAVRIGSYLKLPNGLGVATRRMAAAASSLKTSAKSKKISAKQPVNTVHVVRRGDTLIGIAKRYAVSVREIVSENNLSQRSMLNVGRRLVIPD